MILKELITCLSFKTVKKNVSFEKIWVNLELFHLRGLGGQTHMKNQASYRGTQIV